MSDSLIAILGLGFMAAWLIRSCWREYWKQEAFERGEALHRTERDAQFLEAQRDKFAQTCKALTKALRETDAVVLDQSDRIAQIEARELPQLAELRGDPFDWAAEHPPIFADVSNVVPLRGAK